MTAPALAETPYRTGTCPTGYAGKGDRCEALHTDTPPCLPEHQGALLPVRHLPERRRVQGIPMTARYLQQWRTAEADPPSFSCVLWLTLPGFRLKCRIA